MVSSLCDQKTRRIDLIGGLYTALSVGKSPQLSDSFKSLNLIMLL